MNYRRARWLLLPAAILLPAVYGADRAPVLVELFTSEGCSSCPPADVLLEKLDPAVVVLSEHVTYWDTKLWRDRFSLADVTSRQQGYAERFHLDSPYTPEMVVNGSVEFNGSNARRAADEIAKASDRVKAVPRLSWVPRGVQIQIDGQLATHYIYSFKELDALRRGGVQRIYSGNIATGTHEIVVSVSGKLANGKDYTQSGRFPFTKEIKPKLIGVTLAGPDAPQPGIHLGDW